MNPEVFKIVKWSFNHLVETNEEVTMSDLEAEVINLASFLYLKDAPEIDFELNYLESDLVDEVEGGNPSIITQVTAAATMLFPRDYTSADAALANQAVLMNLRVMGLDDYSAFLKAYFLSKHKIALVDDNDYNVRTEIFKSPVNSLWQKENGKEVMVSDSDTDREVICKFNSETGDFDVLINPYNPNVKGKIFFRGRSLIRGMSHDKTRMFEFLFDDDSDMEEVIMHRLDKGDLVKYHKSRSQVIAPELPF
jgi:hypothetical protein